MSLSYISSADAIALPFLNILRANFDSNQIRILSLQMSAISQNVDKNTHSLPRNPLSFLIQDIFRKAVWLKECAHCPLQSCKNWAGSYSHFGENARNLKNQTLNPL